MANSSQLVSETTVNRLAALEAAIQSRRGRWLILAHDSPDPDALASATLLAKLLRVRYRQRVTLAYGGIIGRPENREMVRALRLEFARIRDLDLRQYKRYALVDAQPRTGNTRLPADVVPDLVFDHHFLRKATRECPFHDVRTDYAASASIVAEYVLAAGLRLTRREATAVVYAIRTETLDFSREAPGPDQELYDALLEACDRRTLGRIQTPPLPAEYFSNLHDALEHIQTTDSLIVTHLDAIDQPDIVAEVADLLVRMEGKTWSLCTGLYEGRIYCSIRTTNPRAQAARIMRKMLGRRGKGGGHGMLAGGFASAPRDPVAAAKLQVELGRKLARLLKKNPDRLTPLALAGAREQDVAGADAEP